MKSIARALGWPLEKVSKQYMLKAGPTARGNLVMLARVAHYLDKVPAEDLPLMVSMPPESLINQGEGGMPIPDLSNSDDLKDWKDWGHRAVKAYLLKRLELGI